MFVKVAALAVLGALATGCAKKSMAGETCADSASCEGESRCINGRCKSEAEHALDEQIAAELKKSGAKSVEELAEARARIRRGEVVDIGGRGDIRDFKTLQEVFDGAKPHKE